MKDGTRTFGRIVSEENGVLSLVQSGFTPNKLSKLKLADVASSKASTQSMMPPALINSMNADELKDLIAYFVSQGNARHALYKKPTVKK